MKKEGKIIIGIMLSLALIGFVVYFIYERYFQYDDYDVEYASGYTIINGTEYPFCPDIPRYNERQSEKERKKMPRPKISVESAEDGKVRIKVKNIDEYHLPVHSFEVKYSKNIWMGDSSERVVSLEEDSDEVIWDGLEEEGTYYVKVRCDASSIYTKWSRAKKIKIKK